MRVVAQKWGHQLTVREGLLGGIAIHKTGTPFPTETEKLALEADAVLMGAVGLPEFDNSPPHQRPEAGLLGIRKTMGVFANLRPVRSYKALLNSSPLKNELVDGVDMIIVRELDRVSRMAFELARKRRRKLTSVDKSNVLDTSQLWRRVVTEVAKDYGD